LRRSIVERKVHGGLEHSLLSVKASLEGA